MIKLGLSKYQRWRGKEVQRTRGKNSSFCPSLYPHTLLCSFIVLSFKVYPSISYIWANFMTYLGQWKPTEVAVGTKHRPQKACEFLLPLLEFCSTAKTASSFYLAYLSRLLEKHTHGLIHSHTSQEPPTECLPANPRCMRSRWGKLNLTKMSKTPPNDL